jgi:hypothetical protein
MRPPESQEFGPGKAESETAADGCNNGDKAPMPHQLSLNYVAGQGFAADRPRLPDPRRHFTFGTDRFPPSLSCDQLESAEANMHARAFIVTIIVLAGILLLASMAANAATARDAAPAPAIAATVPLPQAAG